MKEDLRTYIEPPKNAPSKLDRLRKAGLIGCLNDTGLTSKNYKNEIYKES